MAQKQLKLIQQVQSVGAVAKLSFRIAPGAVTFKVIGSLVDAILPLAVTYYAALTTTALASAYNGDTSGDKVFIYIFITVGLGLFMTVWRSLDQYIQAKMRYVVEAKVTDRMYDHFLSLDFWRYDDKETADLYDRAQKFSQFFAWVFDRIAGVASQFIIMVTGVVALTFVNGWLAFFVLVAIVPGVVLQFQLSRKQVAHWNENVEIRRVKSNIEWNMFQPQQIAELRTFGLVKHLMGLRTKYRDQDEKTRIEFEARFIPKRLAGDALETLAELGSLLWVTAEIIARSQPIGQFLYVQQVVSRAMSGASGFINQLSMIDEDVANLFEYEEFMKLPERVGGSHRVHNTPDSIVFDHVSFHYVGDDRPSVLDDISMTIKKNQHIAIVGENGAGKSTFIKLLLGLYDPTVGKVTVDGVDMKDVDLVSWHKQIGLLRQDFVKYNFARVRDNVAFGDVDRPLSSDGIYEALRQSEAAEFVKKLPMGIDSFVNNWMEDDDGNKGTDLSGGQWQRLAMARSFYRDAPVVILDEPTSAIDALAESRIFERLFKEKNKTIVTISHRVTTIQKADVIYMFENGKVVEQGTHTELVKKHGAYYRMFKSQLQP